MHHKSFCNLNMWITWNFKFSIVLCNGCVSKTTLYILVKIIMWFAGFIYLWNSRDIQFCKRIEVGHVQNWGSYAKDRLMANEPNTSNSTKNKQATRKHLTQIYNVQHELPSPRLTPVLHMLGNKNLWDDRHGSQQYIS